MTLPQRLMTSLRCIACHAVDLELRDEALICLACDAQYPIHGGIPSLLTGGAESQDWNPWDLDRVKMMGDSYYKRASGKLPEKESSKSYANLLVRKGIYQPGDSILDLGCAAGHFLRSFRRVLGPSVTYTGVDITAQYLLWGKELYGVDESCSFVHGDVLDLPFADRAFDIVVVNLFHFFPSVDTALQEALRVARKMVVWRTPVGVVNYVVKVIYTQDYEQLGPVTPNREDMDYSLYMLFSEPYIEGLVKAVGGTLEFFERDEDFGEFDNRALEEFKHVPATRTVNGMQVNGNLILDWHYVGIGVGA